MREEPLTKLHEEYEAARAAWHAFVAQFRPHAGGRSWLPTDWAEALRLRDDRDRAEQAYLDRLVIP